MIVRAATLGTTMLAREQEVLVPQSKHFLLQVALVDSRSISDDVKTIF